MKSYPYSGCSIPTKPLVSSVGSLWTKAEWDYSGSDIRANVAYDLFTASDPNHSTSSGDYEIMIWYGSVPSLVNIQADEYTGLDASVASTPSALPRASST